MRRLAQRKTWALAPGTRMGHVFPLQNLCSWGTSSRQWSTRCQGRGRETPPVFTLPQRDLEQGNDPTPPSLATSASVVSPSPSQMPASHSKPPPRQGVPSPWSSDPRPELAAGGSTLLPSWSAGPGTRSGTEAAMRTQALIMPPCEASSSALILESLQEAERLAPGHLGRMWESCNFGSVLCDLKTGPSPAAAEETF